MIVQPLPGMPRKVVRKAAELGMHNDCMVAGVSGCCDDCMRTVILAMDHFYAHVPTKDVPAAVDADLQADRDSDVDL